MTPQVPAEPDDLSSLFVSRPIADHNLADAAVSADRVTLLRTLAVVRRHGIKRRMAVGAAIALVATASFGVGRFTAPSPVEGKFRLALPVQIRETDRQESPRTDSPLVRPEAAALFDRELEDAARILKQRGDQLLYEHSDISGALDCYRQHLEIETSTRSLRASVDDSWLLAKLKDAHLEKSP